MNIKEAIKRAVCNAPWQDAAQAKIEKELGRKMSGAEFNLFMIAWMAPAQERNEPCAHTNG